MKQLSSIILASQSSRRRELLKLLGVDFQVRVPKFKETSQPHLSPEQEALHLAREKARSLSSEFPHALIVGSDTLVVLDDEKLGKPRDEVQALAMLEKLSGREHRVLTGLVVLEAATARFREHLEQTCVRMKPFNRQEAMAYVASGEPMDKAGAYAVQGKGRELIELIEGDYFNVVGLPLKALAEMLQGFGVSVSTDWEKIYKLWDRRR